MAKMLLGTTSLTKVKSDKPKLTGPVLTATQDYDDVKEGDKLTSDAIQVKYLRAWTNDDGSGDDIEMTSEDLLTIIHGVDGDNHASWEKRADMARDAHNKSHPIADMSQSIPQNVKELAAEADDELGSILFEIVEAGRKSKYGPLLVMHELERVYETTIDQWPMPDNDTEDGKPKANPNYKWNGGIPAYDKGYRAKPKGEKGTPSWYADFYDSLPDLGGHRMGLSVAEEKVAFSRAKDKAPTQQQKQEAQDGVDDLTKERTSTITLVKRAMKLRFKLQAIGPIVMRDAVLNGKDKIKVRAKETGLKNAGYVIRIEPRTGKIMRTLNPIALQDVGTPEPRTEYRSVGQIISMTPEGLPEDCSFQALLDSGGTGTEPEDNVHTIAVFKDVDKVAEPALMIVEASFNDTHFSGLLQRTLRMKDRKTGRYLHMPLVETLISIRTYLESLGQSLAEIKAEDEKVQAKLDKLAKEKAEKAKAAA